MHGAEDEELSLDSYVDEGEEIDQHTVSWGGLCVYFSVSFYFETADDARKFFEVAQNVVDMREA